MNITKVQLTMRRSDGVAYRQESIAIDDQNEIIMWLEGILTERLPHIETNNFWNASIGEDEPAL